MADSEIWNQCSEMVAFIEFTEIVQLSFPLHTWLSLSSGWPHHALGL